MFNCRDFYAILIRNCSIQRRICNISKIRKDQILRYKIEFGSSYANRLKAQKFRQRVFKNSESGLDEDEFDEVSDHCLIYDRNKDGKLVLVFRSRNYSSMKEILNSYSAQYYDLTKLTDLAFTPMEIGRLCVDKEASDPFLLLHAFKYLVSLISSSRTDFIFGCTDTNSINYNPEANTDDGSCI